MNMQDKLARLHAAKIAEDAAREKRIALEMEISEAYRSQLPDGGGERTFKEGTFKFAVQTKFNLRCTDFEKLASINPALVITKPALDEKAYKALWETDRDAAVKASMHITVSPAKPRVTIKSVTEGDDNGL